MTSLEEHIDRQNIIDLAKKDIADLNSKLTTLKLDPRGKKQEKKTEINDLSKRIQTLNKIVTDLGQDKRHMAAVRAANRVNAAMANARVTGARRLGQRSKKSARQILDELLEQQETERTTLSPAHTQTTTTTRRQDKLFHLNPDRRAAANGVVTQNAERARESVMESRRFNTGKQNNAAVKLADRAAAHATKSTQRDSLSENPSFVGDRPTHTAEHHNVKTTLYPRTRVTRNKSNNSLVTTVAPITSNTTRGKEANTRMIATQPQKPLSTMELLVSSLRETSARAGNALSRATQRAVSGSGKALTSLLHTGKQQTLSNTRTTQNRIAFEQKHGQAAFETPGFSPRTLEKVKKQPDKQKVQEVRVKHGKSGTNTESASESNGQNERVSVVAHQNANATAAASAHTTNSTAVTASAHKAANVTAAASAHTTNLGNPSVPQHTIGTTKEENEAALEDAAKAYGAVYQSREGSGAMPTRDVDVGGKSPIRKKKSPAKKTKKSPAKKTKKSPVRKTKKSPVRKTKKSPVRKTKKSPAKKTKKSPTRKTKKSPAKKTKKSPTRKTKK